MPNYYEILSCEKNASLEELKKSYREQVKKIHPDKSGVESREEFLLLDKAWKTLRNPSARKEYDLTISKNEPENGPLYCELELEELNHDAESGIYCYVCRCGGMYALHERQIKECEKLRVPCDECTFHIAVVNTKFHDR